MNLVFLCAKMEERTNFTYDAWKEYLKSDKEMNSKWKSLTELSRNVSKDLKDSLESLPYAEALKRRKFLTAKNIFNLINTAKEKPNFNWIQKLIYNEEDERYEYVIQCIDPSSDYIFRKIKEERWVVSMFWDSINKYLQPVADKIWALKDTLRVSIQTETKPSDLSYESLKTKIPWEMPEWAEDHYAWNDRDIVDENGDVVLNPEQVYIPVKNEYVEDETLGIQKEKRESEAEEDGQLKIPFEFED